jgi:glutamyl-tRNA synthetase
MPTEGTTTFKDVIRGEISFENSLQDDFVLLKSDGFPTYNFANVIDDHLMEITNVIRGEEFISSTPKHLHLYWAFGWDAPALAHPSLILGPDRSKLSKRHGAVNFASYIEEGYLPDALFNFLVLLGWSAGEDREIYSREELIEKFTLEGITDHPAIFDAQKLLWINGVYIRQMPLEKLTEMVLPYLKKAEMIPENPSQDLIDYIQRVVALEQERMKLLSEAPELMSFFLKDKLEYDPKGTKKWLASDNAPELLNAVADRLQELDSWTVESLEATVREAGEYLAAAGGKVIHPVRMAATGKTAGPGLFETLEVLGKDRVVSRLKFAAEHDWQKELE